MTQSDRTGCLRDIGFVAGGRRFARAGHAGVPPLTPPAGGLEPVVSPGWPGRRSWADAPGRTRRPGDLPGPVLRKRTFEDHRREQACRGVGGWRIARMKGFEPSRVRTSTRPAELVSRHLSRNAVWPCPYRQPGRPSAPPFRSPVSARGTCRSFPGQPFHIARATVSSRSTPSLIGRMPAKISSSGTQASSAASSAATACPRASSQSTATRKKW